jgi:hypothetical protein
VSAPDIATPTQRRAFLGMLSAIRPGTTLSANLLHDDAHLAAQIPGNALGGLFRGAAEAGLIFRVGFVKATDPAAKGRWLVQWERTAACPLCPFKGCPECEHQGGAA